jgi:hypothetical protein
MAAQANCRRRSPSDAGSSWKRTLVDVTPEMGTMHFASGSHKQGYLGDLPMTAQRRHDARFDVTEALPRQPLTAEQIALAL